MKSRLGTSWVVGTPISKGVFRRIDLGILDGEPIGLGRAPGGGARGCCWCFEYNECARFPSGIACRPCPEQPREPSRRAPSYKWIARVWREGRGAVNPYPGGPSSPCWHLAPVQHPERKEESAARCRCVSHIEV